MQQVDDPPSLPVGTEVSAKYKGAFCEAKVSKVVRNIKVKVAYKQGLGSGIVSDDLIKAAPGQLRVGATVEVRHPDRKDPVEATVTKIQDCSQYTVVFDDGDITTLRRTALCLKSGRHFNESETLDQLPLTHPEHFGNPVVGGRRGRRRGHLNEDSSEEEEESESKEVVNEKEENIGKVVCVEIETKKKDKEKFFPGLVVAPTAQATVRIRVKDDYLVRSFKDGRYYTVPKKEATEFTREAAIKQDSAAVQAALEFLDNNVLPAHWDRDTLFGLRNSSSDDEGEVDSDSSDDEPREEKDRFVAQLYKYMDDRGTPLNKVPTIQNRDVDLYRLFRAVQKRGGYNRVTSQNQWKSVATRLGFTPVTTGVSNMVKQSFKKFLQPYGDFNRKLGCSMLMTPRNSSRTKGRSLVRAISVASPKPTVEPVVTKEPVAAVSKPSEAIAVKSVVVSTLTPTAIASVTTPPPTVSSSSSSSTTTTTAIVVPAASVNDESENTSESSQDLVKNRRKATGGSSASSSSGKVKILVEKYEEKTTSAVIATALSTSNTKDEGDLPLSKIKAAAVASNALRFLEEKEARERESSIIKDVSISSKDSARSGSTPATRDPSPAGSVASTTTSIRKDKPQRKSIPTTAAPSIEERRNKRKKDEVSVEKVDVGDFIVEVGDKLKVYYHEKKVTYEAKVIEITLQRGIPMYMVHYTGWNNRYDEWVPRERIAENLSKSYKNKKGQHFDRHGEKNKENPPKPPSSAALAADLQNSLSGSALSSTSIMAAVTKAATTTTISKRGRGRSESARTRSVTPSSVASNSGRTQSISHTVSKHRRSVRTGGRRVSITASDMSLQTESETDSDEPVKPRSTRASKDTIYKPHPTSSKKLSAMAKPKTGSRSSAVNSQSETGDDADDDEEDGPANSLCSLASSATSSAGSTQKGRDYDLNQIRSELKGFKVLKSPSPSASSAPVDEQTTVMTDKQVSVDKIKDETLDEATTTTTTLTTPSSSLQVAQSGTEGTKMTITTATSSKNTPTQTSTASSSVVELNKSELIKKEKLEVDILPKSTTDISSETDSYADDDSQSSDRTTQLQNMTKKFQQKINADKQRIRGKNLLLSDGSAIKSEQNVINPKTRIVEKILKDSLAEKRQESLKNKPSVLTLVKEETRLINRKDNKESNTKPSLKLGDAEQAIDDIKGTTSRFTSLTTNTTQPQPTVTANTATTANVSTSSNTTSSSKYSSVIVDKPLNIGKKIDTAKGSTMFKKTMEKTLITETLQNIVTTSGAKDFLKIEPPAAASPTSSTSSISSHISSNSSRSIPDMSKLDISSPSSSSSSFKDVKATSNALMPIKPTSPDIYEFKDNEPFEFQIRKLPLSAASAGVGNNNNLISHVSSSVPSGPNLAYGVPLSARRQSYKPGTSAAAAAAANADSSNFVPTLLGRKKRGSPFKDITTASDKLKQSKLDDKSSVIVPTTSSNLVADAKLLHHVMPTVSPPNSSKSSICTPSKLSVGTSGFSTTTSSPIMPITTPTIITTTTPPTQTALTAATSSAVCVTPTIIKSSTLTAVSTPMPTTDFVAATTTTTPTTATSLATTSAFSPAQKSANAFDVLRKSPSFNLINALNEEIAQTVQETTGALTDVAMPVTPSTPPIVMDMLPLPSKTSATTTKEIISTTPTTTTTMVVVTPVTPSGPKASEVSSTRQSPVTPKIMNSSTVTTTTTTINTPTSTKPSVGVGSPFMETKKNLSNVFEMCAYEGATTSVGGNRDTKFGLEKAKFLLSATVGGGFDFEPTLKTEHKPISIADKLLKAISQKKEEENKIKEQKAPEIGTTSSPTTSATQWPVKPLSLSDSLPNTDTSNTLPALCSTPTNTSVDVATMPFVPPISSTKPLNSPEPTKLNLLEANAAKNTDLNETIQKLECAIQRKTCASLKTVATAALPFSSSPNTSVPTVMPSPAANFSEESIDSTDSERRLVIEDVSDDLPKSPIVMLKHQSTPTPRARSVDVTASMQQQLRHSPVVNSPIVMAHASNVSATGELQNTVCISVPEIPVSVVMAPIATGSSVLSKHKPMPLHLTTKSEISGTATTITTTTKNNLHVYSPLVTTNVAASATPTTSGFFSNSRTALRPEDGVKPISDMLLHAVSAQADAERAKEEIEQAALIANAAAIASGSSGGVSVGVGESHQHDSINLLCEETIPGSPAPVINKDEIPLAAASPARTSLIAATTITTAQQQQQQQQQIDNESQIESNPADKMSANDNMMQIKQQQQQHQSSPNDSCSQDESQDDDAKKTQSEHEFGQCKRRRTRKTSERDGQSLQQQQQQIQADGSLKRRRTLTHKKHNQGSDSDENSDTLALRSANISTRQQQMQQQQFQVLQQPQLADQIGVATGLRPCPYNFLVQLDPTLSSDQCIAILLKQIQELRKTYNNIKGDLAAIDRRRKKIRRRNREKKQNQQINPQPAQLMKVSATT